MPLRNHVAEVAGALALGAALVAATVPPGATQAAGPSMSCRPVDLEVPGTVTDAQVVPVPGTSAAPYSIRGEYCRPAADPAPKVVLLALHGSTYTHAYWNAGLQPGTYSFARAMTDAGYATFALDRLGHGASSHPASALVTLDSQAATVHAVVGLLRAGKVADTAFPRVVLVGHSYGTAVAWLETSRFNDADAVIGTAWASTIQSAPLARFSTHFYPAAADPKFVAEAYDPGYFTALPGTRSSDLLYHLANADPAMVRYDYETLRGTVTGGEFATFYGRSGAVPVAPSVDVPLSDHQKSITVPAFLAIGRHDLFFCGPDRAHCTSSRRLHEAESPYFSDAACLRAASVPDAGHNLNLHRNAPLTFRTIRHWLDEVLGKDGTRLGEYHRRCVPRAEGPYGDGATPS